MGVFTYENEVASVIPLTKFFKAFIIDADNLYPKIVPNQPQTEIVEGDGGPGTIKKITFNHGGQVKIIMHRLDIVDEASLTYKYTVLEGDLISDTIDQIVKEIKVTAGPDGGSILKNTSIYHIKGDNQLDKEKLKTDEEKGLTLFKIAAGYLLTNPDEYN
ncbi:major allergen Pru ar 1-like [Benincasa hispida]|uniref:major allergen Pru ar 1-like n=1 Tax=Benincasa hispida TaxID=102211 RepID=UPI0019013E7A|nr:major allergen Pru ar 1-like [Benincasa hispida]